jgi:CheY-specific phosphatase CheX
MTDLSVLLAESAEEVLENMFFSAVMGVLPEEPGGERFYATVTFGGSTHGELSVSAAPATATQLAAGFLGTEDETVADAQVRAVVGEIANVLCGVVLGHLDPTGNFVISPPRVTVAEDENLVCGMELQRRFELMEGDLAVGLTVH